MLQIADDAFIRSASDDDFRHSRFVFEPGRDLHDFDVFAALAFGAYAGRRFRPLRADPPVLIGHDVPIAKVSQIVSHNVNDARAHALADRPHQATEPVYAPSVAG